MWLNFNVLDITSSDNGSINASVDFAIDPLQQIQTSAIILLTKLIHSDDADTAIVAKDTLKAVLMTEDGVRCCREIECDNLKRLIAPSVRRKGYRASRSDTPEISDSFYRNLLSAADKTKETVQDDRNWCWSDKLWTCKEGEGISFVDWIKNVVCALLLCCYRDPQATSKTTNNPKTSVTIEGSSRFFRVCAKICSCELNIETSSIFAT